jgi:hypothetical protein
MDHFKNTTSLAILGLISIGALNWAPSSRSNAFGSNNYFAEAFY